MVVGWPIIGGRRLYGCILLRKYGLSQISRANCIRYTYIRIYEKIEVAVRLWWRFYLVFAWIDMFHFAWLTLFTQLKYYVPINIGTVRIFSDDLLKIRPFLVNEVGHT